MKCWRLSFLLLIGISFHAFQAHSETEQIDLKALAKKARPAVMLLVVSDANGKEIATGTGFLVSSNGKLITNHHVIEGAASVVAKAENGGLFPVEGVLADDPKNDLALLKLTGKDLPFLTGLPTQQSKSAHASPSSEARWDWREHCRKVSCRLYGT